MVSLARIGTSRNPMSRTWSTSKPLSKKYFACTHLPSCWCNMKPWRTARIGGYDIAAGTRLRVNVWKLQRDPLVWSEPDEYRPERFLSAPHAGVDVRGQHFELIPFGSGRRSCPGISFALQVMHLTLARVIQGFELETPGGGPLEMVDDLGLPYPNTTPLEVLLRPRLADMLYE